MRIIPSRSNGPRPRYGLPPTGRPVPSAALLPRGIRNDEAEFLSVLFNALSHEVIALDGRGRVVALSESAELAIRHGTLLRLRRTTLIAAEPIRGKFEAAVRRCSAESHDPNAPTIIAVSDADPRFSAVRVAPLPRSSHHFGCAAIVVLERALSRSEQVLLPELTARFTPAETEIAHALLRGQAPSKIARWRGVSIATVRSQIKSVYAKAGVTNRGEFTDKAFTRG